MKDGKRSYIRDGADAYNQGAYDKANGFPYKNPFKKNKQPEKYRLYKIGYSKS